MGLRERFYIYCYHRIVLLQVLMHFGSVKTSVTHISLDTVLEEKNVELQYESLNLTRM